MVGQEQNADMDGWTDRFEDKTRIRGLNGDYSSRFCIFAGSLYPTLSLNFFKNWKSTINLRTLIASFNKIST